MRHSHGTQIKPKADKSQFTKVGPDFPRASRPLRLGLYMYGVFQTKNVPKNLGATMATLLVVAGALAALQAPSVKSFPKAKGERVAVMLPCVNRDAMLPGESRWMRIGECF